MQRCKAQLTRKHRTYLTASVTKTPQIESPIISTTIKLLKLSNSRFTNKEAIEFLNLPAVQNKLGISSDDLGTIEHWIASTGIHWGLDQEHINSVLESDLEVTWHWQAGLERLMLGIMMHTPSSGEKLWNGILPFSDIEQNHAGLLHSLTSFISSIRTIKKQLQDKLTLASWVEHTRTWLAVIFDDSHETQAGT